MSELHLSTKEVFTFSRVSKLFIYNHCDTVGYKIKKLNWGWLLRWPAMIWLAPAPRTATYLVFVYRMCMRATIVYIYLCDCIEVFKCEAHFNMIIVPASVCGVTRWWRALLVSQSGGFSWGGGGVRWWWHFRCFRVRGSVQSQCRPESSGKLFYDLRTVAPGFGLPLGQGQPGRLRGDLRRVTGGEALWHLLDSRGRRCRVCNLNWDKKIKDNSYTSFCYTTKPFQCFYQRG